MLVLSRKPGESIQISDNICITVTEVRGGRVKLSFSAPSTVKIVRQELARTTVASPGHPQDMTAGHRTVAEVR
ncbi:MAG: carbon storage regulator [Planctomycetaceae bacterium]|nr:carbon storage regulator [Planctomycetaceae bacterium]